MAENNIRVSEKISRKSFLRTAGAGVATIGLSGVARAEAVDEGNNIDNPGHQASLIGAVRMDMSRVYVSDRKAPYSNDLLFQYIKTKNPDYWAQIKEKIDYVYENLDYALPLVLSKGGVGSDQYRGKPLLKIIKKELSEGKKLFFKPNLVAPSVLSSAGDGSPGGDIAACTDWCVLAAAMRWFHDQLGVKYHQMAFGDAASWSILYSLLYKCKSEGVLEGVPFGTAANFYAGYPFYFVRKYLHDSGFDENDDPMDGFSDSVSGNYIAPGQADKLMVYDLNKAEDGARVPGGRGRLVQVPGGADNYPEGIIIHKALVGDPTDAENYPGSVIINIPKLKVHPYSALTCSIKNLGMGAWPILAGADSDPSTTDYLYSYPGTALTAYKGGNPGCHGASSCGGGGGVYHSKYYVTSANNEGIALTVASEPNKGLHGSMLDMYLAIRQNTLVLNIVDAVNVTNVYHSTASAVFVPEGFVFASEDPVALDLFCARYMSKMVSAAPSFGASDSDFFRNFPVPKYDPATNTIITDYAPDSVVSRDPLFAYAEGRGLGQRAYYVKGMDFSAAPEGAELVSKNGHLGRLEGGTFTETMTSALYYHNNALLWWLQPTILEHAKATDALTIALWNKSSGFYDKQMTYDENLDGAVDFDELGKMGGMDSALGISSRAYGKLALGKDPTFFIYSRYLKISDKAWNNVNGDEAEGMDFFTFDSASTFIVAYAYSQWKPSRQPPEPDPLDPFFKIPYGRGKWPSLQYARYMFECGVIYNYLYPIAASYAAKKGYSFTLYVPSAVPYVRFPMGYNPSRMPNVEGTSDRAKIFTAVFKKDGSTVDVW